MRLDEALAEYMHKCDSGSIPDRESFLDSHPDLKEQLSDLLNAADWIEEMAGPTIADLAGLSEEVESAEETLPHVTGSDGSKATERTVPSSFDEKLIDENLEAADHGKVENREFSQPVLPCQFGDYVLERVLGRGGMGVVYCGHQKHLDRPVAIKMIRSGALASEEEVQRFYAEARSAAQLDHPNIVTVYQCGEQDGHRYFSMDYVPGTDLSRMIKEGPVEPKRAARYVRDLALAIQYAHDKGILHRDLKPANVLVDENDRVHITDFGLAKSIGTETGLTATGAALGTPSYMSPEQAAGRVTEHHHATDIYSLGAILFTLVTGKPPFKSNTVVQTIMQVIHRPAPMARTFAPSIDSDVETIIDVCLQKTSDRRYSSASDLAADLDRYLAGRPIEARPMSQVRRAWYWLLGVPIFGAVLDHRVVEPTEAHRWFQRGLISVAVLVVCSWLMLLVSMNAFKNRMPSTVRVAAGVDGGSYDQLAKTICEALDENADCEAIPVTTAGSSDNIDRLERGEVELALLQADSLGSGSIAVVAPLYYEAVHILVRADLGIASLAEFRNRRINVGPDKAGSQSVAQSLLRSVGISLDEIEIDTDDWHDLKETPDVDAAIVVSKLGSSDVNELLCAGDYQLLSMSNAWQFALDEPSFHPLLVETDDYPDCQLPDTGIATVATTAFLAARTETPAILVQTVLTHLFAPEMVAATGIVSAERAAHWQGIPWHPAAREFFSAYHGSDGQIVAAVVEAQ